MTTNINPDADGDDTEGHRVMMDGAPGVGPADPTAPKADHDTDDDTVGHRVMMDEQPGLSGAVNPDPDTRG